jgi:hypothetical protein
VRTQGGKPRLLEIRSVSWIRRCRYRDSRRKERPMLDLMMVVLGLGFFVLALGFVAACDGM